MFPVESLGFGRAVGWMLVGGGLVIAALYLSRRSPDFPVPQPGTLHPPRVRWRLLAAGPPMRSCISFSRALIGGAISYSA